MGVERLSSYASSMKHVFSKEGAESIGGFGSIGSLFAPTWDWYSFWNMTAFLSVILAFVMLIGILAGCAGTPAETTPAKETLPADYPWATYYSAEDAPFLPKDIFSQEMYVTGFTTGDAECGWVEVTDREDTGAFVFPGEYGKNYEIKVPAGATRVLAIKLKFDPTQEAVGKKIYYMDTAVCDKGAVE